MRAVFPVKIIKSGSTPPPKPLGREKRFQNRNLFSINGKSRQLLLRLSDTKERLQEFIENGYAGVRPIPPKTLSSRGLSSKLRTNWDIIADLKRVKVGDLILLHVEKGLYGLFRATSCFKEEKSMPNVYKSKNLNLDYWSDNKDYWPSDIEKKYNEIREGIDLYWKVGIESVEDMYFDKPLDVMEIFKLMSIGEIQTIPARFLYDGEKTVKPMLESEKGKIIKLLEDSNNGVRSKNFVDSCDMRNFEEIKLDLRSYENTVSCEKILEAYIMENITLNKENVKAHEEVRKIVGEVDFFANTVFTYYTNFIDVFCQKRVNENSQNVVIELKKGDLDTFPKTLNQIMDYTEWVQFYMEKGVHAEEEIVGIIIARKIDDSYISWKRKNPNSNVKLCKYDFTKDFSYLKFREVV